jgi:hypothetical protein
MATDTDISGDDAVEPRDDPQGQQQQQQQQQRVIAVTTPLAAASRRAEEAEESEATSAVDKTTPKPLLPVTVRAQLPALQ